MKRLLFLAKHKPGESAKEFANRIIENLKKQGIMDENGKVIEADKNGNPPRPFIDLGR